PPTLYFHLAHRVTVHRSASSAQPMRFHDDHLYLRGRMPHSAAVRNRRAGIPGSPTGAGIRPHRSPHPTQPLRLIQRRSKTMSEYLTYTLWKQREERMPHELEHQRVVQERLQEQELEVDQTEHEYVLVDE